jgi:serine/threonine-protein kinase RsbW
VVRVRAGEPATPPATRRLVECVASGLARAGWAADDRDDVVLAVDEAVQNAIEHGSEPDAPVVVELEADGERAHVRVRDHGRPGAPTPAHPPEAPPPHQIRGRGRVIMAAIADDAHWHERAPGTEVELRFSREAVAPADHQDRVSPPSTRSDCPVT